ncbi:MULTISPECIES: DsbA family protein [Photorhabdus]|uniref:DsbA family protein n=1 Tax=Photorhabdus kayaii TaxID=230088 RepID=A0ABX0B481_9GAMM|nr:MULTISPECIES: DsbA family protein [Photorhabdus]MCC8374739.1 DsbA family protein [Photorhabdus bodei]MCT8352443.1 DsbA family protein [Photorhabdus kayaii]NDL13152.1 DsbA family protein [Photorhabdus kayaii]NDL26946.1 DsbA family protein [Photorhabdus kayaii]RAX08351.1 protein-disulfide isomerase [Photorhabdus sp. HUG-39]
MPGMTLHYIYDPLCGWCYGVSSLIQAAKEVANVKIELHGGGMLTGDNRRQIDSTWRDYVLSQDKRIASLTGQIFSEQYVTLLNDKSLIMDSLPPISAILAAEKLAVKGVEMLLAVQKAHYVRGLKVSETETLLNLANELQLDSEQFQQELILNNESESLQHIRESRELLAKVGGSGFPTFILENNRNELSIISLDKYLGQPKRWQDMLIHYQF